MTHGKVSEPVNGLSKRTERREQTNVASDPWPVINAIVCDWKRAQREVTGGSCDWITETRSFI